MDAARLALRAGSATQLGGPIPLFYQSRIIGEMMTPEHLGERAEVLLDPRLLSLRCVADLLGKGGDDLLVKIHIHPKVGLPTCE